MNVEEYVDICKAIEQCIVELKTIRKDPSSLDKSYDLLMEMKFNGIFNYHFRQQNFIPLQELLDEMYEEINS